MRHRSIITSVIVAIALSFLFFIGAFSTFQLRIQDALYGSTDKADSIVILAIDDRSIQEIGRWPWDRSVYAQLLPKLAQAKIVAIDAIFSEPSNKESDAAFAKAIKDTGNVILSAEYTSFTQENGQAIGATTLEPLPELKDGALGIGIINLVTDTDGVVRSANSNIKGQHKIFAEEIARQDAPKQNRLLINMLGPKGTIKTIPVIDVL